MEVEVNKLYTHYRNRFLQDWKHDAYEPCIPARNDEIFIEEQLSFIFEYLCYLQLDGDTPENLARIKGFLDMQNGTGDGSELLLMFLWGEPVFEVFVCVENLSDIDFADTHRILNFKEIQISRVKKWRKAETVALIEEIRKDFRFDGMKADLSYESRGGLLEISCKIE